MDDNVLYEAGVDLDSSMTFQDGDILLSQYENNLAQAVANRLNTQFDELDLFYQEYGSMVTGFFGWRTNNTTLRFIRSEIDQTLSKESRLLNYDTQLEFDGEGVLKVTLKLYPADGLSFDMNLVLTPTGVANFEIPEEDVIVTEE